MLVEERVGGEGANAAGDEEDVEGRGGIEGVCGDDGFGEGGIKRIHSWATGRGGDGVEGWGDECEF